MRNYIFKRFFVVLPFTLLGAATIIFLIIHLVPGDPVLSILQDYYTQTTYENLQRNLGLDRPLYVQYVDYLWNLIQLDLGTSFQNKRPVIQNIAEQFPHTVRLTFGSLLVAIVIALPTGIIAAVYRGYWPDYLSMFVALFAITTPVFMVAIILILIFSLYLGWFPSHGVGDSGSWRSLAVHLILPAVAQGMRSAALLARITRSSLLDAISQDYVRTARAKGLKEGIVIMRHAFPNALIPVVTVIGLDIAYLLGGAVVIETVFSRQGVGRLLVQAILARDYPQIQGTLLILVVIAITINAVVDLVYGWIDPRITYE